MRPVRHRVDVVHEVRGGEQKILAMFRGSLAQRVGYVLRVGSGHRQHRHC